jgi:hypothetical protein
MTDWVRVHAFEKHTYIESFPTTSFLVAGVTFYKDTIKDIHIGDELEMNFEQNEYDASAIILTKNNATCGYVPKDIKEKVIQYVPRKVKVIDKRLVKNNIYSLRVNIDLYT